VKINLKIWQFIIGLCVLILIIRAIEIYNTFYLLLKYLYLLIFVNPSTFIGFLNFSIVDNFISAILIIVIPVFVYLKRNKYVALQRNLNFSYTVIFILSSFFIFAPIVSGSNPEFEKDLTVTKLLPPLSRVEVLNLIEESKASSDELGKFLYLKDQVVKHSYNDNIIFVDSVKSGNKVTYYQKGIAYQIDSAKVKYSGNKPQVDEKIFLLGTDELGRDIFSRLVYGARISLFVGLTAVIITMVLGLSLGFFAGFLGGWMDTILSRFTDMLLAFPLIFLVVLILALFGNSLFSVIIVLGFSGWMGLFKIVRGEVISIKGKEYFISAKMIGLSNYKLLINEVLPVIIASIIVNLVFQYGNVILAEAALSFLGLGTGNSYPSWGQMIESGQNYLTSAWWMILFPGLILFVTLFAANNIGKKINSYFNPRLETW
jgi:peptide/nickel transport system permease protein